MAEPDDQSRQFKIIDMYIEEYRALRTEISDRVKNEFIIVGSNVTLTAVGVALLNVIHTHRVIVLFVIPLVSLIFGLLYLAQESSLAVAAQYLNKKVKPAVVSLLERKAGGGDSADASGIFGWEEFRAGKLYNVSQPWKALGGMSSFLGALPGLMVILISLGFVAFSPDFRDEFNGGEISLLIVDVAAYVLFGFSGCWLKDLYSGITS
ncbi:hypothetical protein [Streptomyces spiramyceticus]|uniref:hypothetical protein n=1 Tax=Streptomyces spiramyceticus TaxID=299717 RepID=UPI00237A6763|nr:hypothetical protein [Streptomyces spiramyceticus]